MLEEVPADLLLQDFGLSITAGAVSGIGILDRNSEIILGGQVVMVVPSLELVVVRQGQNPASAASLPRLLAAVCGAVRS